MTSPIEAQAFDFILRHRRLKLLLVVVSVIGILNGAYMTILPLARAAQDHFTKLTGVKPNAKDGRRFECLIALPMMSTATTVLLHEEHAKRPNSVLDEFVLSLVFNTQSDMLECHYMLGTKTGFLPVPRWNGQDMNPERALEALDASHSAMAQLKGLLASTSVPELSLFELSQAHTQLLLLLERCSKLVSCDLHTPPTDRFEQQRLQQLKLAARYADKHLPFRLPTLALDETSRLSLRRSLYCYEAGLFAMLANNPVVKRHAALNDGSLGIRFNTEIEPTSRIWRTMKVETECEHVVKPHG